LKKLVQAVFATLLLCFLSHASGTDTPKPDETIRTLVTRFEEGLNKRDLSKIEPLVAEDLVVLENGHRNDGWADFRDNHLVPEMKEPALPSKTELLKLRVTPHMAWAYTRTEIALPMKNSKKRTALLWSVYVFEKRGEEWKLVLLDWSIRS
jgi:ketosteroid isomerase-like protein